MRLYRGLSRPYQSNQVAAGLHGTDFTDCPLTALQYAQGRQGVVLVVDVPAEHTKISEELWLGAAARRFMLWGCFDQFIASVLPARELRALVRRKGIVTAPPADKAGVLRRAIAERLRSRQDEPAQRSR
ncbi:MAG: hypothetical protein M3Y59_19945 [Myxococcota bacterium]|nr:hypothetical protein [Myxococcota bacterium]